MIINGKWQSEIERGELADSWLLGDGRFETLRTYGNQPFALLPHLDRLERGLSEWAGAKVERSQLIAGITELLERVPLDSGRLRVIVGADGNWLATHDPYQPVTKWQRCQTATWRGAPGGKSKRTSYGDRLELRRAVAGQGFDDAILVDEGGVVVEATTCNIIFMLQGSWVTPALSSGCLPGVTRSLLLANFGLTEIEVSRSDLADVQAAGLISSLREVQVVESIDGRLLPSSNHADRLAAEFHAWVLGNLAP